jgi:hypothetical protein
VRHADRAPLAKSEIMLLTILPFYQPSAAPRPLLRDSFVSGFHALRARTLTDTKRILGLGSVRLLVFSDRKTIHIRGEHHMTMEIIELAAPSCWAPAIVNLDYSGLTAESVSALNTFLARQGVSFSDCLLCEDPGFLKSHDAFKEMPLAADCQRYFFKVARTADAVS